MEILARVRAGTPEARARGDGGLGRLAPSPLILGRGQPGKSVRPDQAFGHGRTPRGKPYFRMFRHGSPCDPELLAVRGNPPYLLLPGM